MSVVVWANILLAIPFLVAFIGIPLWLTLSRPQTGPDHTQTRAYLRTRSAFAAAQARRQAAHATAATAAGSQAA